MPSLRSRDLKPRRHHRSSTQEDLERILVDHLDFIRSCCYFISRRHGFSTEEQEDLYSLALEKLIDDNYAVLQKFQQKSSWKSFLQIVVSNLVIDYRRGLDGRFRPSKMASELGVLAIRLEELIYRDGFSLEEAIQTLLAEHPSRGSEGKLEAIWAQLPQRSPKKRQVSDESLELIASNEVGDSSLRTSQQSALIAKTEKAIAAAFSALPVEDRMILRLRFIEDLPPQAIASTLGLKKSTFYWRMNRSIDRIRLDLDNQGIDGESVFEALANGEFELNLDLGNGGAPSADTPDSVSGRTETASTTEETQGSKTWNRRP